MVPYLYFIYYHCSTPIIFQQGLTLCDKVVAISMYLHGTLNLLNYHFPYYYRDYMCVFSSSTVLMLLIFCGKTTALRLDTFKMYYGITVALWVSPFPPFLYGCVWRLILRVKHP